MSDISKCKGHNCERKQECYRFTAPENEWRQSWFAVSNACKDEEERVGNMWAYFSPNQKEPK